MALNYNQIKNKNIKQLLQILKDQIVEAADACAVIHNAAVGLDQREQFEQLMDNAEPWVKQVWDALSKVAI